MKENKREYELVPISVYCPEEAIDNVICDITETVYENGKVSFTSTEKATVSYPFAFVCRYCPTSDNAFVYHAMLHFHNVQSDLWKNMNSVKRINNYVYALNCPENKLKVIEHIKECLYTKKNTKPDKYDRSDKVMEEYCDVYISKANSQPVSKLAPIVLPDIEIVPVHLHCGVYDTAQENNNMHDICCARTNRSIMNSDELDIDGSNHMYNVSPSTDTTIELDNYVTLVHENSSSDTTEDKNTTLHEKMVKHEIETADLYTFVLRYRHTTEMIALNMFWDGDTDWADDTFENMYKMLYMNVGDAGIEFFLKVMNVNKYAPHDTINYIKSEISEFDVLGIYRVEIMNDFLLDFKELNIVTPKLNNES